MAVSVSDLPPKYQAQAYQKFMAQQAGKQRLIPPAVDRSEKASKYHNKPTERVTASGKVLRFDSQKEARRYDELLVMLQAGQIWDLRMQVDFTLQEAYTDTEGRRVRAIRYKADFTYVRVKEKIGEYTFRNQFVVEDVKSRATKTKTYAMKRKMMKERFNIDIEEV